MLRNLVDRPDSSLQKFSDSIGTGKALQGYMPGDVFVALLFAVDHLHSFIVVVVVLTPRAELSTTLAVYLLFVVETLSRFRIHRFEC